MSKHKVTVSRGLQTLQQFETSVAYDALSLPETITMPTCSANGCTTGLGIPKIGNTRSRGLLTTVGERLADSTIQAYGSLSYHAAGMVNTVQHASAPASMDTYESTNSMTRPSRIMFSGGTTCPAITSSTITAPDSICGNAGGEASVPSRAGENVTHEWTITGATPATATGDSVNFTANASGTVTLTVTASSACGATASSTKTIEIESLPSAVLTTGPTTIQRGESVPLSVTLSGPVPRRIVWSDGVIEDDITADTWTRNVSPQLTTSFTVTSVSASGCSGTTSGATVVTVIPPAPGSVTASTSTQQTRTVLVTWPAVNGASSYQIERRTQRDGIGTALGTTSGSAFTDTVPESAQAVAYVYYVRTIDAAGTLSSYGPHDYAVCANALYGQPQITPGLTVVKAADIEELRRSVDALRSAFYLPAAFGGGYTPSGVIRASDLADLIAALNDVRPTGLAPPATGEVVRASHIGQLREALR